MTESPRQQNDYDCGVVAVQYMLGLKGLPIPDHDELQTVMKTSPLFGTSHQGIVNGLTAYDTMPIEHIGPASKLFLPCIVNYWDQDDGHYGVAVAKTRELLFLFNPGTGEIERWTIPDFDAVFYSKRYGRNWSCC